MKNTSKPEVPQEGGNQKQKKNGGCLKIALIVIGVIVVLGIIGAIVGGNSEPKKVGDVSTSENQTAGSESEKTVFTKGEIAEMNNVQVTLVDYMESTGSEFNTPAEGNVFLMANFEIANNSDEEFAVSSMLSFEAYADDYALSYSVSAMLEKPDGNQLDGTIAAGKKMNGWIGYEVPADWSTVEIHFTDDVWSNDKFVFEITK